MGLPDLEVQVDLPDLEFRGALRDLAGSRRLGFPGAGSPPRFPRHVGAREAIRAPAWRNPRFVGRR